MKYNIKQAPLFKLRLSTLVLDEGIRLVDGNRRVRQDHANHCDAEEGGVHEASQTACPGRFLKGLDVFLSSTLSNGVLLDFWP